eukprot:14288696-Heterocapsa_arctica.AAC.1
MIREFLANGINNDFANEGEFDQRVKDCMEEIVAVGDLLPIKKAAPRNDDKYSENRGPVRVPREARCSTSCLPRFVPCSGKRMNFTCVKKAIDDMITEHLKQKDEEIKNKDFCVD